VQDGATQIVGRSVDGWTNGFPTANATDGRDAIVAVAMNGQPLPIEHGFPARIIVPGLYGYVSATKWVTELELTGLDDFDGYWVRRGWAKEAPIRTQSRIDTPKGPGEDPPGPDRRRRRRLGPAPWHRGGRGQGRRRRVGPGPPGRGPR
jgi:DMSO/TMAO reductase YedYZ molybdopterin-dependent catalytic subunit